jgi:hypothetical protein
MPVFGTGRYIPSVSGYIPGYIPTLLYEKTTRVFRVGRYIPRVFAKLCQVIRMYEYNHIVLVICL